MNTFSVGGQIPKLPITDNYWIADTAIIIGDVAEAAPDGRHAPLGGRHAADRLARDDAQPGQVDDGELALAHLQVAVEDLEERRVHEGQSVADVEVLIGGVRDEIPAAPGLDSCPVRCKAKEPQV